MFVAGWPTWRACSMSGVRIAGSSGGCGIRYNPDPGLNFSHGGSKSCGRLDGMVVLGRTSTQETSGMFSCTF